MKKTMQKLMGLAALFGAMLLGGLSAQAATVAKIGDVEYETLQAAFDAVAADPSNKTLTWVDETAWPTDKQAIYGGTQYATLTAAITAANSAGSSDAAQIFIRPNHAGLTVNTHELLKTSITIYGNNASVGTSWEPSIEAPGDESVANGTHRLTKNVAHAIYALNEGAGFWGTRCSDYNVTLTMVNCQNAHEGVYALWNSGSGKTDATICNCTFKNSDGNGNVVSGGRAAGWPVAVYGNGSITVDGCSFEGNVAAVVGCLDASDASLAISITNTVFKNLKGQSGTKGGIRIAAENEGNISLAINDCSFTNGNAAPADITIGDKATVAKAQATMSYSIVNTACSLMVTEKNTSSLKEDASIVASATPVTGNNLPDTDFYVDATDPNLWHIANKAGLVKFRDRCNASSQAETYIYSGKTIQLDADIDLNNEAWTPIDAIQGHNLTFDGNGHTVANFTVTGQKKVGFFGDAACDTIKNLTISNATVTGINHVAAVGGYGLCTHFINCKVYDSVITTQVANNDDGDKAGAICGYLSGESNAEVTDCYVEGCTIKGYRDCGGAVGYANNTASVTGNTVKDTKIINDQSVNYKGYATNAEYDIGEVVGEAVSSATVSGNPTTSVTITYPTMVTKVGYNQYATLAEGLNAAKAAGKTCELLKDIDLTGVEWTPVADFAGTFDGQGHTISGLTLVEPVPLFDDGDGNLIEARLGLFANINAGIVKNLTISGATVTSTTSGARHIGVLAGSAYCGSDEGFVSNVIVTASHVNSVGKYVGGLIGNDYTDIYDCQVLDTTVTGKDQVGGVAGYMWCGSIEGCTATGNTVTATEERAGGLVGKVQFCADNDSPMWINGNTVSGTATAPDYAGGIVAQVFGDNAAYAIKDNSIDVTLSAAATSPIGVLRNDPADQPDNAFTQSITKNMTGNLWSDATSTAGSYTFSSDYVPASKNYTVYRGRVRIGETLYQTLAAAIAAVKDGETIDILADNAESVTVPDGVTTFTFNSNGFDLSKGSVSVPAAYKFVRDGNVCTYQPRVYGVAVIQEDGTARGTYESLSEAVTAAQAGDTVAILQDWTEDLAVPAGKSITFDGRALDGSAHTLDGAISVAEGGSLKLLGGTFTANPFAYLPDDKAVRANDDGTYTVVVASVAPVQEELPEAVNVTDEKGNEVAEEKQEQAAAAVETLKTNLVESVSDPVVTKTDSGLNEVVKESESVIVAALKAQATEDGLTEGAKNQIDDNIAAFIEDPEANTNSSNCVAIEVAQFNATVASVSESTMTGTATKVVYEVTPIIKTTVSNTVGTVTEVVTVSAAIPNATVKAMAEKGNPITFNLPILDVNATMATVKHVSAEPTVYPTETFTCPVWTDPDTGKRYITVTVSHFSTFEVTASGAVLVDSDETIGIYRLDKLTAGEVSVGVPFTKSGVTTETVATLAQLVTTGAQTGDSAKAWTAGNTDTNGYASVAAADAVQPGKALWYVRNSDSTVPLTIGGFVKDTLTATGAPSTAADRPGMTLFANPNGVAFDALAKLTSTAVEGDQIVIEGDTSRYAYDGTAWTKAVQGDVTHSKTGVSIRGEWTTETVTSIAVPAGKVFWYVTTTGTPAVQW